MESRNVKSFIMCVLGPLWQNGGNETSFSFFFVITLLIRVHTLSLEMLMGSSPYF